MASPLQQIVSSVLLDGSPTELYVSPSGVWTQIVALTATNATFSPHTVTLNIVPLGSAAGSGNASTQTLGLLPSGSYNGQNEYGQILNPGDSLWGAADAAGVVTVFASGLLATG
jgi:hypothetical protein